MKADKVVIVFIKGNFILRYLYGFSIFFIW